jgi:hypothetical protein
VRRGGVRQIGVERRRDRTHQRTRFVDDLDRAPRAADQPVRLEPRQRRIDLADISAIIAHQGLDDRAAALILAGDAASARGGEFARGDAPFVVGDACRILDESLGQPTDGRRAQAQQHLAGIGRVALEIAVQSAVLGGGRKAVAGQREMVEADLAIAGGGQGRGDRLCLLVPFGRARQGRLVDLALVRLERGDMGIAEHRKSVGLQPQRLADGVQA